jgi:tRNA threonylcarbamoyladenosine biosynthesis protein TsaE
VSTRATARCDTEDDTRRLAARVAGLVRPGQVVELVGELGAGKTTFAKGYAAALGVTATVTSPTFTLVHQYRCGPGSPVPLLLHADLWRLDGAGELGDLALEESLDEGAAALVEWGDRFGVAAGHDRVVVTLRVLSASAREVTVDLALAGLVSGDAAVLVR